MPLIHITGEFIDLECAEPFLPEFPEILIAESTDDGVIYFDATACIEAAEEKSLSVDHFFFTFNYLHLALTRTLGLDPKKVVRTNRRNHILIDANYAFLFISYVKPDFIAYLNNKIIDMFTTGMAFSEAYLGMRAAELPGEVLLSLANGKSRGTAENEGGGSAEDGTHGTSEAGTDV